jgi:hypothetical protein
MDRQRLSLGYGNDLNPVEPPRIFSPKFGKAEKRRTSMISWSASVVIAAVLVALPAVAREPNRSGEWQGVLLQNGERASLFVAESEGGKWTGAVRSGSIVLPLDNVRVSGSDVHFEVPGIGAFDGSVASDWMAGAGTGAAPAASFALTRKRNAELDAGYVRNPPS